MKWWRWYVLLGLFALPAILLMGFGLYFLWQSGWGLLLGWMLLACIGLSYYLANHWQKKQRLLQPLQAPTPAWTERDQAAWKIVETYVAKGQKYNATELLLSNTYQDTAQNLALDLARHYHPKVKDPISALTIPEILTVIELATHDLSVMVDEYLPGGHLLTIRDLRRMKKAADWYPHYPESELDRLRPLLSGQYCSTLRDQQRRVGQALADAPGERDRLVLHRLRSSPWPLSDRTAIGQVASQC